MGSKMKNSGVKRTLVVEDEPAISDVCRKVLNNEGFEVDIADNGKVAQGMLENNYYDLCLIDMKTPIMGGEELYVWLLQEHPKMARRVLFTTGDVMGGDTQLFIEKAARPFLPKPFTPNELRNIVRATLKKEK